MVRRVIAALLFISWFDVAAATRSCPGSSAVGTFQLRVQPPGGGPGRSIRRVNILASGSKIFYQPGELPPNVKKDAKVALLVAPPGTGEDPSPSLTVLELRLASSAAEWTAPFRVGTIMLVFGPQGLDEKRVTNLVTKDEELVAQLADYAEQTADLEATVEALTAIEQQADGEGIEPRPGGTPSELALLALLRSFNPVATAYNPLGAGRVMSPVSLRGKAAAGFFENAGAVVPGGGVLPGLKSWLFPDTEFRAAFVQPAAPDSLTLCAQRSQARTRNRVAFLWAHRLVNADAPSLSLAAAAHLPIGARASLDVKARNAAEWQLAGRFDEWTLVSQPEGRLFGVPVRPALQGRALEVDLRKFSGPPGPYRSEGQMGLERDPVAGRDPARSLAGPQERASQCGICRAPRRGPRRGCGQAGGR